MNKIIITVGVLLVLGTLAAALMNKYPAQQYDAPVPAAPAVIVSTTTVSTLTSKTWVWESSIDAQGTEARPPNPDDFELRFQTDGILTSTTDCNSLGGSYSVNGVVLGIGSLVATEKFCSEESLEQAYAGLLGLVGSYAIEGKTLTLVLLKDAGSMTFSAKE